MTRREAMRLALLIAWDDMSRGLDTSDEWARHPETDEAFTVAEVREVKAAGLKIAAGLEARAARLERKS